MRTPADTVELAERRTGIAAGQPPKNDRLLVFITRVDMVLEPQVCHEANGQVGHSTGCKQAT